MFLPSTTTFFSGKLTKQVTLSFTRNLWAYLTNVDWKVHRLKRSKADKIVGWKVYRLKISQDENVTDWKIVGWKVHWLKCLLAKKFLWWLLIYCWWLFLTDGIHSIYQCKKCVDRKRTMLKIRSHLVQFIEYFDQPMKFSAVLVYIYIYIYIYLRVCIYIYVFISV